MRSYPIVYFNALTGKSWLGERSLQRALNVKTGCDRRRTEKLRIPPLSASNKRRRLSVRGAANEVHGWFICV